MPRVGKLTTRGEGGVVVGVGDQAQVGQRVLDLLALEEAQAAIHPVGHAAGEQLVLQHPRLGVRAVQQRDVGAAGTIPHQGLDLLDDPARLVAVGEGLIHADRLAGAAVGPQVLAEALGVVADQALAASRMLPWSGSSARGGSRFDPEIALEVAHVADLGAAEGVDRLVVVAHAEEARPPRGRRRRATTARRTLKAVGVLELIHQDVAETGPGSAGGSAVAPAIHSCAANSSGNPQQPRAGIGPHTCV